MNLICFCLNAVLNFVIRMVLYPVQKIYKPLLKLVNRGNDDADANKTNVNLMDLHDHCLLQMLEYLTVLELAMLADTNTRFRELVKRHFKVMKIRSIDFKKLTPNQISCQATAKILRHFGGSIFVLIADRFKFDSAKHVDGKIICLIVRYCQRNLILWILKGFEIQVYKPLELIRIFPSLEHLTLCTKNGDNFVLCADQFPRLKTLIIKLEVKSSQNDSILSGFIARNPQLKKIIILHPLQSEQVIETIGRNSVHLEHLNIVNVTFARSAEDTLKLIGSMKSLKTLILRGDRLPMHSILGHFVVHNVGIEYLEIFRPEWDVFALESLPRLRTLKTFKYSMLINDFRYCNDIAEHLPRSCEFHVKLYSKLPNEPLNELLRTAAGVTTFTIVTSNCDIQAYYDLLSIVKERQIKIKILFLPSLPKNIPSNVIKTNIEWIVIDKLRSEF